MPYKPKKSLGQNFMLSEDISKYMVNSLQLASDDIVVEIGPGLGAVTQTLSEALFEYGSKIYAVEIDSRFISKLEQMFKTTVNVSVVEADILEWLPKKAKEFAAENTPFKVLGSLPYYITSPILHMLVKLPRLPETCVLLIQKEVAEKISAKAPDASYLSVFLQTFFEVDYLKEVPREVFKPVPKVDGGIVRLTRREALPEYLADLNMIDKFEGFLHKGFQTPRKMLNKPFTDAELARSSVDGTKRPQALSVGDWQRMFEVLVLGEYAI
ncbi:ribosomal RNA small subunit methyltransferase A [candidate division WWE3 bacterium]|nr:ribosomal RNA small subunit methyltransferase A [candidate division WWE3 bacterium]